MYMYGIILNTKSRMLSLISLLFFSFSYSLRASWFSLCNVFSNNFWALLTSINDKTLSKHPYASSRIYFWEYTHNMSITIYSMQQLWWGFPMYYWWRSYVNSLMMPFFISFDYWTKMLAKYGTNYSLVLWTPKAIEIVVPDAKALTFSSFFFISWANKYIGSTNSTSSPYFELLFIWFINYRYINYENLIKPGQST